MFTTESVLVILDLDKEMRVETDILNYAMGRVLSVKYEDEKQRLVVFISKLLNATEQNYKIYDKEILAVIQYLESQKHYLKEIKVKFEI